MSGSLLFRELTASCACEEGHDESCPYKLVELLDGRKMTQIFRQSSDR
jgi:hypothetical protein